MRIRYWPNSVDEVTAIPADDGSDGAWKVLAATQSLSNLIPSPAGWVTDELFPSSQPFDEDYWRGGVVGNTPQIATALVPALPMWGYQQDDAPIAMVDESYLFNGISLRSVAVNSNRRGFMAWGSGDDDLATGSMPPSGGTAIQMLTLQGTGCGAFANP